MGCMAKLFKLIGLSIIIFVGVLLGPNTLPENVKFTEFHVTPTKYLGQALASNEILNNAERLFENEIKGPEGFVVVNGELYTTVHGGYVVKVYDDQIIPFAKFGQPCEGWWEESKCGRPLGIEKFGTDHIIVADSYYGIFKCNTVNGKVTNLVDKNVVIDGKKAHVFNGVAVAKDGSIYWTHSSTDFSLQDAVYISLADGSGRLIKYDPITQKNIVLMKDLFFANGVALSPDEDFLLVAESGHSRILKYYLKGPNKFKSEIFIDGLPGVPDNLRFNEDGSLFTPLIITRNEKSPTVFQVFSPFPLLRKFIVRFFSLVELSLGKIHEIYPNYFIKRALHYVGHAEFFNILHPIKAIILEINLNGNVIRSHHGSDGSVTSISDVIPHKGYLYLGSPYNNYLGRIKLSKLGDDHPINKVKQDASATVTSRSPPSLPKSTTPKPTTTTTPRPTTTAKPTTTTSRPTTTPKPTTTTSRPTTTTSQPITTSKPTASRPPPPSATSKPVIKSSTPQNSQNIRDKESQQKQMPKS